MLLCIDGLFSLTVYVFYLVTPMLASSYLPYHVERKNELSEVAYTKPTPSKISTLRQTWDPVNYNTNNVQQSMSLWSSDNYAHMLGHVTSQPVYAIPLDTPMYASTSRCANQDQYSTVFLYASNRDQDYIVLDSNDQDVTSAVQYASLGRERSNSVLLQESST